VDTEESEGGTGWIEERREQEYILDRRQEIRRGRRDDRRRRYVMEVRRMEEEVKCVKFNHLPYNHHLRRLIMQTKIFEKLTHGD
jgi:hypothetical protein